MSAQAEEQYRKIRRMRGDVRAISRNTGILENIVRSVRRHLFIETHRIAVGPRLTIEMRFAADSEIADLWIKAAQGDIPLTPEELVKFQRIIAHEYVEHSMIKYGGLPYRSDEPAAWIFGYYSATPTAFGAHDVAPHADWLKPAWGHHSLLGLS